MSQSKKVNEHRGLIVMKPPEERLSPESVRAFAGAGDMTASVRFCKAGLPTTPREEYRGDRFSPKRGAFSKARRGTKKSA